MGKKDNKKKLSYKTEEQQEIIKFIILVVVIVAIVVGIYFLTRTFVTKENKKDETQTTAEASVNYDVTIVGSILNRPYDEYYVIAFDSTSVSANKYNGVYTSYTSKKDKLKMYLVDLSNSMNASYYSKNETNPDAKSISDIKLGDFTLIKVKKGQIVKYIEDYDSIKSELKLGD